MKKRIIIAVGGLGVLASIWILSLNKYQGEVEGTKNQKEAEDEEKSSRKPYRSKRFPAAKIKINRPVKKIEYDTPLVMKDLKPKGIKDVFIDDSLVINLGRSSYGITKNIKVVPVSERHHYEASQIVDQKYGKIFVKEPRSEGDALVLINSKTKQLAIMTGVFKIKLHDHSRWSELQSEFSLELEGNFPGIRLSLLKITKIDEAPELLERLKKDPRIERVDLEILENAPVIK